MIFFMIWLSFPEIISTFAVEETNRHGSDFHFESLCI